MKENNLTQIKCNSYLKLKNVIIIIKNNPNTEMFNFNTFVSYFFTSVLYTNLREDFEKVNLS